MLTSKTLRQETNRASEFLVNQIRKGWTPEEALLQVRTSYGQLVWSQVKWDLQEYFRRHD